MDAFLVSLVSVALAEIGDKTQLLALVLATRFRKPWPVIAGILLATLANHALAGVLGVWLSQTVPAEWLRYGVALSFVLMGLWILIPDKPDSAERNLALGAFFTTLMAFFLVEIGDKTQIATVVLAAHYSAALFWVVLGTTLGMMVANVPVVLAGHLAAGKLPMKALRIVCCLLFIGLGVLALFGDLPLP